MSQVDEWLPADGGVGGQEAGVDQSVDDRVSGSVLGTAGCQRRARLLPPGVRAALAEADQAQEDPLGDALLGGREVMQRGVGAPRQRDGDSAACLARPRIAAGRRLGSRRTQIVRVRIERLVARQPEREARQTSWRIGDTAAQDPTRIRPLSSHLGRRGAESGLLTWPPVNGPVSACGDVADSRPGTGR
ncbi:MAG TPA: hypothetical protein VF516_34470 [Kofleriaceae bacterium]